MRSLSSKINVIPPGGAYPFGRVRNNDGSGNGTPADEALVGDLIQFFEKLMSDAEVAANGLPDNNVDGFQLTESLLKNISFRIGKRTSVDLNNEKFPGVYTALGTDTNVPLGLGSDAQLIVGGQLGSFITQTVIDFTTGAQWIRSFTPPVTWSAWVLIKGAEIFYDDTKDTTSDGNQVTILTIPYPANKTVFIDAAMITNRVSGGSVSEAGGAYKVAKSYHTPSGVITLLGTDVLHSHTSGASVPSSIIFSVSGSNLLLRAQSGSGTVYKTRITAKVYYV